MLKKIISLVLISWTLFSLEANESLYYAKLGATYPPGDSAPILPNFGLGGRFRNDRYGLDLSANLGSLLLFNYASLKGMFLAYQKQFYFGIGPGIGYHLDSVPLGGALGSASSEYATLNLEGVCGYQFPSKTFIQLEMTQPFQNYTPGIALSLGAGF